MTPTVHVCPHCGAPLAVSRFAAIVTCAFCDATVRIDPAHVSAKPYKAAWSEWNEAPAGAISINDSHWLSERLVARGDISDVYLARRARWPSELAVLKVLRDERDAPLFDGEWSALERLHAAAREHQLDLGPRVPAPIAASRTDRVSVYRWAGGFLHTFDSVRERHRSGIRAEAAIWVWRRILEVIGAMQRCGLVHGAILPQHLLVQNGEHGVRLVGFSCAGAPGEPLRAVCTDFEDFYPQTKTLTPELDTAMSARCVSYLLGDGDVPCKLTELIRRIGWDEEAARIDPWKLHSDVAAVGRSLFGKPAFHPIAMD